jgi:DNA-binding NtrC family response regulator
MLIEDDAFSRKLVENVVGKQYEITSLATADQALNTYARTAPNLLFLDIDLPDVTGHELLAKIMALDPEAHVVMLSGNADRENISKALGIGAKGFVAKPFTRDKLFQYISRCPTITSTVQL